MVVAPHTTTPEDYSKHPAALTHPPAPSSSKEVQMDPQVELIHGQVLQNPDMAAAGSTRTNRESMEEQGMGPLAEKVRKRKAAETMTLQSGSEGSMSGGEEARAEGYRSGERQPPEKVRRGEGVPRPELDGGRGRRRSQVGDGGDDSLLDDSRPDHDWLIDHWLDDYWPPADDGCHDDDRSDDNCLETPPDNSEEARQRRQRVEAEIEETTQAVEAHIARAVDAAEDPLLAELKPKLRRRMVRACVAITSPRYGEVLKDLIGFWRYLGPLTDSVASIPDKHRVRRPHDPPQGALGSGFVSSLRLVYCTDFVQVINQIRRRLLMAESAERFRNVEKGFTEELDQTTIKEMSFRGSHPRFADVQEPGLEGSPSKPYWDKFGRDLLGADRWLRIQERFGRGFLCLLPAEEDADEFIERGMSDAALQLWLDAVAEVNGHTVQMSEAAWNFIGQAVEGKPPPEYPVGLEYDCHLYGESRKADWFRRVGDR